MKELLFLLIALFVFSTPLSAEVKITALPEATSLTSDDLFIITDDPSGTPVSNKITAGNVFATAGYLWPGGYGTLAQMLRSSGAAVPTWSTTTFADTYAKGTFLYNASANTVDALAHPGAANYLMATLSADTAGWMAASADIIALLASADYSTARTNLGLAIGTDVQAYSGILLGIAATTPAAGLLGYTGAAYDWYTGIALSNNSLRHFYDETAGYYSNSDCTALTVPAACCTGVGTGTCAPKYVGINPVGMTGTKSAILAFQNTADATYTFPVATSTLLATTGTPAAMYIASQAAGDMWYAASGTTMGRLPAGATTEVLVGGGAAPPAWTTATGTGAPVRAGTPTLVTPVIGAATGTSLIVTGRLDGTVGMLESTAGSATTISVATHGSSSYFMNKGDSDAHSIFTLPTAAAGLQYCIRNYTGITTVLKFQTSAAGQYIDLDGVNTATGGLIKSAGAAGDAACVVGVDATHWAAYVQKGTWSKD